MDLLTQQHMLRKIVDLVDNLSSLSGNAAAVHAQLIVIQNCIRGAFVEAADAFKSIDDGLRRECAERLQLTERACSDALTKPDVVIMQMEDIQVTINCIKTLLNACISALIISETTQGL